MLTAKELSDLLPAVEALAREAGHAIRERYRNGFEVFTKADSSPVTSADHESDAILSPGLARLTPDIPVVSEEGVEAGITPDTSGGSFWLVDPLDGTQEFINRTDEFTVLIGLILDGVPALGVMYAPIADELYSGAQPDQAWAVNAAGRTRIAARRPPEDGALTVTSSFRKPSARLEAYFGTIHVGERLRRRSAFKWADVARGAADLYPGFGLSYEWDTAAGHALVLAAGGSVTTLDGQPLAYGKPGFRNPDILVYGRR